MILLVDKPTGRTSHDLVKFVKVHGKYKKVGHAGTLDPLATGLMIILTDEDTKQMPSLVGFDKVYNVTIDLQHISDTRDSDYQNMYEKIDDVKAPKLEDVLSICDSFCPKADLQVPPFSAKKIGGKRMYKSAIQGKPEIMHKEMRIQKIELLSYDFPFVRLRCHVGSGTFIRSIAYELGKKLSTGGIVTQLQRESVGDYSLYDSTCILDIHERKQKQLLQRTGFMSDEK